MGAGGFWSGGKVGGLERGSCQLEGSDSISSGVIIDPFGFSRHHLAVRVGNGEAKRQRRAGTGPIMQVDGRGYTEKVREGRRVPRVVEGLLRAKTMARSFERRLTGQRLKIGS